MVISLLPNRKTDDGSNSTHLEVVLLDVGPQLLDALRAGSLLLADDVSELGAELQGLGESGSLGHFDGWLVGGCEGGDVILGRDEMLC